jgi:MOSC domain-containing protein YiiM
MSSPARTIQFANTVLRISETVNHCVRKYEGDPEDLIKRMRSEKRTGIVQVFINQGHIYRLTFDTRVKD